MLTVNNSTDKQHDFRYGNLVFVNLTVEQNDFRFFSFGLCQFSKWAWFKVLEPWSLSIWWMNNMILGIGALVFVNQMDKQHDFRYGSLVAQWLTLACWVTCANPLWGTTFFQSYGLPGQIRLRWVLGDFLRSQSDHHITHQVLICLGLWR